MFDSLISVVVPVYNRQKTLRVCVESILNQEYGNFEIILVDDGSTDQTIKHVYIFFSKISANLDRYVESDT